MKPIKVIDKICGWGKTHYIFSEMRSRKKEKWLYVSPYLSEVGDGRTKGRIQKELPELDFKSPVEKRFGGKSANLKDLIANCQNVAISHQLYKTLDKATLQIMYDENYNVVIDETLDVISLYNGHKVDDIHLMIDLGIVEEAEHGRLKWNYNTKYSGTFQEIKRMCEMEVLFLYRSRTDTTKCFVNKIPPRLLEGTGDTYILTYRFVGSLMCSWLRIHGLEWEYYNPPNTRCEKKIKDLVRQNIEVITPPKSIIKLQTSDTGAEINSAFSKSWFERASHQDLEIIRQAIDNVVMNKFRGFEGDMIYTTFKDYAEAIRTSRIDRAILGIDTELDTTKSIDNFVSKNMRASNEYASATKVIHVCNTYPHVILANYIKFLGDSVMRDEYAISELIQFLFRSAIRNGEKVKVVIFSNRMRTLLNLWLLEDT